MKKIWLLLLLTAVLAGCAQTPHASRSPVQSSTQTSEAPTAAPSASSRISREEALESMYDYEAPDFQLMDLDGNEVSLADHRDKIIFLNFWQTWCPPCREEMPLFEEMCAQNDDLVVLAVATLVGENAGGDDKAEKGIRDFVAERGYTFPVLIEPAEDGGISRHEMYASPYIPANYVIDRDGIIRFAIEGAYSEEMLDLVLEYMRALDG